MRCAVKLVQASYLIECVDIYCCVASRILSRVRPPPKGAHQEWLRTFINDQDRFRRSSVWIKTSTEHRELSRVPAAALCVIHTSSAPEIFHHRLHTGMRHMGMRMWQNRLVVGCANAQLRTTTQLLLLCNMCPPNTLQMHKATGNKCLLASARMSCVSTTDGQQIDKL